MIETILHVILILACICGSASALFIFYLVIGTEIKEWHSILRDKKLLRDIERFRRDFK